MQKLRATIRRAVTALALLCGGVIHASAATAYSGVTFFGDSLSDTGNVFSLTSIFQPPPFPNFPGAPGRFSDGPVWVEHLAAGLGFASASLPANLLYTGSAVVPIGVQGGQNFAFGGARTGLGGSAGATTGLLGQWVAWNGSTVPSRAADPDALYVLLAGANDMRDLRSGSPGALSPLAAAANIANIVSALAQAGARHFLIGNLPDLGAAPEAAALGRIAESTAATIAFNASLAAALDLLDLGFLASTGVDLDIVELDLFALLQSVIFDATTNGGASFGITNVSTPCIVPVVPGGYYMAGSTAVGCDTALFSDMLHPSSAAHRLLGNAALAALDASAVPEPATQALIALAVLAGIATTRRRCTPPRSQPSASCA
jgi:phospholipase/lecithinase/hemolysin